MQRPPLVIAVLALLMVALLPAPACARVLAEWDFTRLTSGWKDEAGSAPELSPLGTAWPGSANGISLRSPLVNQPTEAFQAVEIGVVFDQPGQAHLLWQGEAFGRAQSGWQGPLPIEAPADGQVHELRLLPFWQNVKLIESLRIVAVPGTRLRLKSLRIVGSDLPPGDHVSWDLTNPVQAGQWLPLNASAALRSQPDGLHIMLNQPSALLTSPSLDVPTYQYEWVSARLAATTPAPRPRAVGVFRPARPARTGPDPAARSTHLQPP